MNILAKLKQFGSNNNLEFKVDIERHSIGFMNKNNEYLFETYVKDTWNSAMDDLLIKVKSV